MEQVHTDEPPTVPTAIPSVDAPPAAFPSADRPPLPGRPADLAPPTPTAPAAPRPGRWVALATGLSLVAGVVGGAIGAQLDDDAPVAATAAGPVSSVANPGRASTATGTPGDLQDLVAQVERSVVSIRAGQGQGTGVVLTPTGEILTNAHVIEGARTVSVTIPGESQTRRAEVVDADEGGDLALLRLADTEGLTPADLGSSAELRVGDDVVAIGNALGLRGDPSVTRGIVSGRDRSIGSLTGLLQTDAAINPGNSGGPLVNDRGQVIGINTAVRGNAQNIGFAIPIDTAKAFVDRARSGEPAPVAAFLGTTTREPADGSPGAEVVAVESGSAAERAGLEAGDRIVSVDGQSVAGSAELGGVIRARTPGSRAQLGIVRDGEERTLTATLAERTNA